MTNMNLQLALSIMRTGEGELRPIIDYYAETGMELELLPYLNEQDILPNVLYVLSELPKVHEEILRKIEQGIENENIPDSARVWAEEILFNHY